MFRRHAKLVDAIVALWVVMVCAALVAAPTRLGEGVPLFSSVDEVDPVEEDDVPSEDSLAFGSTSIRARTREELHSFRPVVCHGLIRISPSSGRASSPMPVDVSGTLIGRNGCDAILRC
jgi:hypothetical protein